MVLDPGARVGRQLRPAAAVDDELGVVLSDLSLDGIRLEAVRLEPGAAIGEDDFIPPA